MGFRSELADVLRLYRSGFAFFRLAQVEAEALVWHHGSRGVAIARAREALNAGEPRVQRLHDWLECGCWPSGATTCSAGVDVGTRYEVAATWSRRPGQMILR
jgi:hypothetical protein